MNNYYPFEYPNYDNYIKMLEKLSKEYDIKQIIKTITFDNGVEFAECEKIEKYLNIQIYFANPYSSWQR